MRVDEQLYSVLQPVFGDELYPVRYPDPDGLETSTVTLFGVYSKVGGESLTTLDGRMSLNRIRMQVSIYSIDYETLKLKERAVINAMQTANTAATTLSFTGDLPHDTLGVILNIPANIPVDGYEEDSKRFCSHLDYYCWEQI